MDLIDLGDIKIADDLFPSLSIKKLKEYYEELDTGELSEIIDVILSNQISIIIFSLKEYLRFYNFLVALDPSLVIIFPT